MAMTIHALALLPRGTLWICPRDGLQGSLMARSVGARLLALGNAGTVFQAPNVVKISCKIRYKIKLAV